MHLAILVEGLDELDVRFLQHGGRHLLRVRRRVRTVSRSFLVELLMVRWLGFMVGALTFAAAHAVESVHWHDWFHGAYEAWFLNSGSAILFTVGAVALASAAMAALAGPTQPVSGLTTAAGAFVAMTAIMFLKPGGPGSIFPIVMAAGGAALLVGSIAGAWAATRVARALRARR
jgi:hypothetical protein